MTDETKAIMKPEEAIIEMRSLQVKHNKDIKQLQEELKLIQEIFTSNNEETTRKIQKELEIIDDKLAIHTAATSNKIDTGLHRVKDEMTSCVQEQMQKVREEMKQTNDQYMITFTTILREIQEIKQGLVEINMTHENDI